MKEHEMVWDGYFRMSLKRDPDLAWMDRLTKSSMRLEIARLFDDYLDVSVIGQQDQVIRKFGTISPTYRLLGVYFSKIFST